MKEYTFFSNGFYKRQKNAVAITKVSFGGLKHNSLFSTLFIEIFCWIDLTCLPLNCYIIIYFYHVQAREGNNSLDKDSLDVQPTLVRTCLQTLLIQGIHNRIKIVDKFVVIRSHSIFSIFLWKHRLHILYGYLILLEK